MSGVNVEATAKLAAAVHIPIIASGGVTNLDDIKSLCTVADEGVAGLIIGRALYEGVIDLASAQAVVDRSFAA
jgi:phosphoribosylformimino-5-aminoimidazole carboxamide ribotide isomerase